MHTITHTRDLRYLPGEFYLFSYGANDVENLAKRFFGDVNVSGTTHDVDAVGDHTTSAFLQGYLRTFFGYSDKWKGSVASLIPTCERDKGVYGLLTHVKKVEKDNLESKGFRRTKDVNPLHGIPKDVKFVIGDKVANLKGLCQIEAVNSGMYVLKPVGNCDYDLFVYAFVGCHRTHPTTSPPSKAYLSAVGKTLSCVFPTSRCIHIPIRYGDHPKIMDKHVYHNIS